MTVKKRDVKTSSEDLIGAIDRLNVLLIGQKETDAVKQLEEAVEQLKRSTPNSTDQKESIEKIIDAFEGEHELMAYTIQRDSDQWTEAEELFLASSRVISLARRIAKSIKL